MSIKPIDFQVIIPKTSEVSRINNDIIQKSQINQHQDNVSLQEQVNQEIKQVNERQKPNNVAINQDDSNKGASYSKKRKKKNKNKDVDNEVNTKIEHKKGNKSTGNTIDIRI